MVRREEELTKLKQYPSPFPPHSLTEGAEARLERLPRTDVLGFSFPLGVLKRVSVWRNSKSCLDLQEDGMILPTITFKFLLSDPGLGAVIHRLRRDRSWPLASLTRPGAGIFPGLPGDSITF